MRAALRAVKAGNDLFPAVWGMRFLHLCGQQSGDLNNVFLTCLTPNNSIIDTLNPAMSF